MYQGIPVGGYTKLVENLMEGIEVRLNEDYLENKAEWNAMAEKVVYTGAIDAYFDYALGNLEYRSVCFENEILDVPNFQGNAAVNYTDKETPWTRIIDRVIWFISRLPLRRIFLADNGLWQIISLFIFSKLKPFVFNDPCPRCFFICIKRWQRKRKISFLEAA